jgi:hypothetical protein
LFVRIGDILSAGIVLVGSYLLVKIETFAIINALFIISWLVLATIIARHYKSLVGAEVQRAAPMVHPQNSLYKRHL